MAVVLFTGSATYVVPARVVRVRVDIVGAGGAGGAAFLPQRGGDGGDGGTATALIDVSPGDRLEVSIGTAPSDSRVSRAGVVLAAATAGLDGTPAQADSPGADGTPGSNTIGDTGPALAGYGRGGRGATSEQARTNGQPAVVRVSETIASPVQVTTVVGEVILEAPRTPVQVTTVVGELITGAPLAAVDVTTVVGELITGAPLAAVDVTTVVGEVILGPEPTQFLVNRLEGRAALDATRAYPAADVAMSDGAVYELEGRAALDASGAYPPAGIAMSDGAVYRFEGRVAARLVYPNAALPQSAAAVSWGGQAVGQAITMPDFSPVSRGLVARLELRAASPAAEGTYPPADLPISSALLRRLEARVAAATVYPSASSTMSQGQVCRLEVRTAAAAGRGIFPPPAAADSAGRAHRLEVRAPVRAPNSSYPDPTIPQSAPAGVSRSGVVVSQGATLTETQGYDSILFADAASLLIAQGHALPETNGYDSTLRTSYGAAVIAQGHALPETNGYDSTLRAGRSAYMAGQGIEMFRSANDEFGRVDTAMLGVAQAYGAMQPPDQMLPAYFASRFEGRAAISAGRDIYPTPSHTTPVNAARLEGRALARAAYPTGAMSDGALDAAAMPVAQGVAQPRAEDMVSDAILHAIHGVALRRDITLVDGNDESERHKVSVTVTYLYE